MLSIPLLCSTWSLTVFLPAGQNGNVSNGKLCAKRLAQCLEHGRYSKMIAIMMEGNEREGEKGKGRGMQTHWGGREVENA